MAIRILAVDDEVDVQMIIKTGLEVEGFNVMTASNGMDALVLAREQEFDLILLDVMMPQMDGFEVLQKLKSDDATSRIPVIMLTGLSSKDKIHKALVSGIDYYIVKPFDFDELITKIRSALKAREDSADGPMIEIDP